MIIYFTNVHLDKIFLVYEDGLWLSQGLYAKAYQSTDPLPWKLVNGKYVLWLKV